jgi:cytoskeletal protein CcmA (bactofilin family)
MKKIDKISTFIGPDTKFEGKLKYHGTISIDGHFKGEISGEGTLIVGEGALIESDIHVSHLLNSGEIRGNVTADKRIQINASGKILGDIEAPTMAITEGAIIEGNCMMQQAEKRDDRALAMVSSDKSAGTPSS